VASVFKKAATSSAQGLGLVAWLSQGVYASFSTCHSIELERVSKIVFDILKLLAKHKVPP